MFFFPDVDFRINVRVGISLLGVELGQGIQILNYSFTIIIIALFRFDGFEHFRFGFVHQIAGYVYFSYFKPFSFPDVDFNINSFFIMGYFRFSYLGVDKTVVVVICGQLAYVLFQLILLEQAGIGEKMQKTVFIGGHHVFELFCRIGLITFKGYGSNIDPLVFLDIQDDPEIFFPVFLHSVRYFGVVVSFAGIESFKGFNVCFNFFLIQYLSGFDRQGVGDVIFT